MVPETVKDCLSLGKYNWVEENLLTPSLGIEVPTIFIMP